MLIRCVLLSRMIIKLAPHSSHMATQRLPELVGEMLTGARGLRLDFTEGPLQMVYL